MSDLLLAKPNLPPGTIDCSVGEAHVVREALLSVFDIWECDLPKSHEIFEYQKPAGYKPLVQLLESQYRAPVVVCNGAKNALGAAFYALKQMGKVKMGMMTPYWALIPPLMEMHGLQPFPTEIDSYLCVAPNNPCGTMPDLQAEFQSMKERGIPWIHDAAYHTHTYLPHSYLLEPVGDVQIYSISKMFGLSSLRLGFVVCHNTEFYKHILQYVEAMTVGVSVVSQVFLYNLLNRMHGYPSLTERFESLSAAALKEAKSIIKQVDPEILEIPDNIESVPGMFLWCKTGAQADFQKAKVNIIDGQHFGAPGYVRMNLAFDAATMQDIVQRFNSAKEATNIAVYSYAQATL